MSDTMNILAIAQSILMGGSVTKAIGADEDPDAMAAGAQGAAADERTGGASTDQEGLDKARAEAQASQAAAAAQGGEGGEAGGAPGGDGDGDEGGQGGEGDGDGDEVAKAEILASMKFLASMHNLSDEEVAKAFSGLEGDPTKGKAPVGAGVELLEKIVEGQNAQNKILDAIAGFLHQLSQSHVSLSGEVTKAINTSEEARAAATKASTDLAAAVRTASPAAAKAETLQVAKALPGGHGSAPLTSNDLFKLALAGKLSPVDAAAANRSVHYGGN